MALEEVEAWAAERLSFGEREGILDGQTHIGHTELCLHTAVDELHGAVHNALRVDEHLDFLCRNAKKPLRFHHLKTFVHERGRVDGDFRTHVPRGMTERVGSGDFRKFFHRHLPERTARAGEQDFFNFVVALAYETLENGRVFAINGQDGHVVFLCELADEFSSHDERLFVGKADFLPRTNGMNRGFETRKTHHCCEYHVNGAGSNNVAECLSSGINLDVGLIAEQLAQHVVARLVGDDHGGGIEPPRLLCEQFHLRVGRERIHFVVVRMLTDDVERLCADGASGTEYADIFHFSGIQTNVFQLSTIARAVRRESAGR